MMETNDQMEEAQEVSVPTVAALKENESYSCLELVQTRLRSAVDRSYYNGLYNQLRYSFGYNWDSSPSWMSDSSLYPDYPPIDTTEVSPGAHRGVFVNQFLSLVKTMFADPRPEYPQLDEVMEELRRQAFMSMWTDKGWAADAAKMILAGNGSGIAFMRGGWRKNEDGFMETDLMYQCPTETMWDPYEQDFKKARWVAFLVDIPPDEALTRWPDHHELITNSTTTKWNNETQNLKRVRVLEYYDRDSRYVFVGNSIDPSHILEKGETPFKDQKGKGFLPAVAFQYFMSPKVKRPIGTILIQMSSAEELRSIYKAIGEAAYRQPLDIVDYEQIDKTSLEQVQNGTRKNVARKPDSVKDGVPAIERVPPPQVQAELFRWKEMQEMEFNQTGNSNEYERNTMPSGSKTKYEVQLYQAKSQGLANWTQKQTLIAIRDVVELWERISFIGHEAPIELDYNGHNIEFNGEDPRSDLRYILEEKSTIVIDETSLRAQDVAQDQQNKMARLDSLFAGVQAGAYNAQKYWDEKLLILGEKDLTAWKPTPPPMMPGQPMPGEAQDPSMMGAMPAGPDGQQLDPAMIEEMIQQQQQMPSQDSPEGSSYTGI